MNQFNSISGVVLLNVVSGGYLFRNVRHIRSGVHYFRIVDEDLRAIHQQKSIPIKWIKDSRQQVSVEGKMKVIISVTKARGGPPLSQYYFLNPNNRIHERFAKGVGTAPAIESRSLNQIIKDKTAKGENTGVGRLSASAMKHSIETEASREIEPKVVIERNLPAKVNKMTLLPGPAFPKKRSLLTSVIERKYSLVQQLKSIYKNRCQICSLKIDLGFGESMSEVHHIQPLGAHGGPDIASNMVVVCPNCHTLFDRGAITLDLFNKKVIHVNKEHPLMNLDLRLKHEIDQAFIDYHNSNLFRMKRKKDVSAGPTNDSNTRVSTDADFVDYGDTIMIIDKSSNEPITLKIEEFYNRIFMTDMQRMVLGLRIGSSFSLNGFQYAVTEKLT